MRKIINITQAHITQAIQKNPYKCPVALALAQEVEPAASDVAVFISSFQYFVHDPRHKDEKRLKIIPLPKEVEDRIALYDNTGEMWPFSFSLDLDIWG